MHANSKKRWRNIRAVLKSLQNGSTHLVACKAGNISDGTWWAWKQKDPKLQSISDKILSTRSQYVVDALYKSALQGSVLAQKFYLNNRARKDWQEVPDVIINLGDDNSKHITQIFQTAPDSITFDDGDGDRASVGSEVVPADCSLTPQDDMAAAGGNGECPENRLP